MTPKLLTDKVGRENTLDSLSLAVMTEQGTMGAWLLVGELGQKPSPGPCSSRLHGLAAAFLVSRREPCLRQAASGPGE